MSNQPNEAAQRYSPCREKSETLVGGVVTTMKPNDQGNWVRYSLLRKAEAEISSLRSALANAEKDQAASARDWEAALSAHDRRVEELNQALAKLAEAEKALLAIGERAVCDFDDATVGDVDRVVTDHMKYKDWLRSVMTAASERDALAAQFAEARREQARLHKVINDIQWISGTASLDTLENASALVEKINRLATPSDRGAEGSCPACGLSRCEDQGVCDGVIMSRKRASDRGTSPSASAPVEVTSEMVERACIAYVASARHHFDGSVPDTTHMRAALTAALKGKS